MSLSLVSSARRRRHGGLAGAARVTLLAEAVTGALPLVDPATGRPRSASDDSAAPAGGGASTAAPAQGDGSPSSSPAEGSARG